MIGNDSWNALESEEKKEAHPENARFGRNQRWPPA
jgi:hypothetical protein